MTQPHDHSPDDAWPSEDMPDVAGAVDVAGGAEPQAEPEGHLEPDGQQPEPHVEPDPQVRPEAQEPERRPEQQTFGDERVDRAVERLAELDERAVGEHVEVFDDIHGRLRDALEEAADDTSPP
jgi:hypothetical protein